MILGVEKKLLWPVLLIGVLAIFVSTPIAQGQSVKDMPPPPPPWKAKPTPTPKPPEQEVLDVVKVTSNLVMVPVSVTDPQGQPVQGLQVADFRLQEEGKQQEISSIGDPEQVPLAIALLFDVSSSTSQKGFFASQQNAAAAFLKTVMKPADRAAIFTITDKPTMVQALASADTSAAKMLTIPAATSPVPTAFYDTVMAAAKYLTTAPSSYRRVIVVLSDGDDNFSEQIRDLSIAEARAAQNGQQTFSSTRAGLQERHRRAVQEVQKEVQKADVIFYSVNPGGPSVKLNQIAMRAESGMEAIAETTGGTAFVPDSDKDLERVFRQVASELRGQYLLQYYADSDKVPAGQFRRIQVAVPTRNDVRVRARQGYYAKKQD
ncbi:MAG TPA: VWA domain-containing protein [Pyrinomonadaceae bacterium]|nr:VWA domain-containing protein [Pyrinomonadaceae bacterium]